ncbi:hypothetical protein TL16_g09248 [Triparma laevis f. inornata]|nr:hypothetical protein TL16_g09248 [Triparma laevis f. inornata]
MDGGYAGYYFRSRKGVKGEEGLILTGKETQLAILSPAGPEKENLYHESHFNILDPNGVKQDGDVVRYGEEFVLADDNGMSWNHTSGGITNYLGFKRVGLPGELCMTFKQPEGMSVGGEFATTATAPSPKTNSPPRTRKQVNTGSPPVRFYKDKVELIVTRSSRANKKIGNPISNFKRGTSRVLGGYLTCEKVGFPLTFAIHRAPPTILTVTTFTYTNEMSMHSFHNIQWGEELELSVPMDMKLVLTQPVISITLSNGHYIMMSQEDVLRKAGESFWVDLIGEGEPGRLLVRFDCFGGNELAKKKISKSNWKVVAGLWSATVFIIVLFSVIMVSKKSKFVYLNPEYNEYDSSRAVTVWDFTHNLITGESSQVPTMHSSFCNSNEIDCSVQKYLWSSESLALSAMVSSLCSTLFCLGCFFWLFGKRVFLLEFSRKKKRDSAPFVGVLLGWEVGLAKDAGKKRKKTSYLDKYGAIDPSTGLPPMPERFLIAEFGDKDKALERWRDTLKWRAENNADDVLAVPHPKFDAIQQYYPQSFYCRDRNGNMVYIERPGGVNLSRIKKNGISVKKLVWHYMYCMEYLWQKYSPAETDRLTTILDLKGVSILMIVGDVTKFIKATISMTTTHYPARGHKLFIINSPTWFNTVWSWVKPMLNSAIEEKLKITTNGEKQNAELAKIINEDNLPVDYGGKNTAEYMKSKYDLELRAHVKATLEKEGLEMDPFV